MRTKHIPEEEIDNLISVYWQMLLEIEANTDPKEDVFNRLLVEGAYNVLNRCRVYSVDKKPRWLK